VDLMRLNFKGNIPHISTLFDQLA